MQPYKMQAPQEVGVNLTFCEAGSIERQMVKKMYPKRTAKYERQRRTAMGHTQPVAYIAVIII